MVVSRLHALITGIGGFAGRYLAEQLRLSGWQVSGTSRDALPAGQLPDDLPIVPADLTVAGHVAELIDTTRPDVIFHLAAQANVPQSFADPAATFHANVIPQLNLFQAILAQRIDPLIVIAGSAEIYGLVQPADLPINETTPLRPVNPYAVAKATQDLLAFQYYQSHGLRTIRLRLFNHIGPRQTEQYVASAFAAQIARIEAGRQPAVLRVGNLAAQRDFSDVRDIARAYESAARHGEAGSAYNVGSDRSVSIEQILGILLAQSTRRITVEQDPARMRPSDVPRIVSDSRYFRNCTGWQPQIPLEQTLRDILAYWRQQIQEHP